MAREWAIKPTLSAVTPMNISKPESITAELQSAYISVSAVTITTPLTKAPRLSILPKKLVITCQWFQKGRALMREQNIHRVFVTEDSRIAGVISTSNILRVLARDEMVLTRVRHTA